VEASSARICASDDGDASLGAGVPLPFGVPGLNDRVEMLGDGGACSTGGGVCCESAADVRSASLVSIDSQILLSFERSRCR
jgi:hypothetical protein